MTHDNFRQMSVFLKNIDEMSENPPNDKEIQAIIDDNLMEDKEH